MLHNSHHSMMSDDSFWKVIAMIVFSDSINNAIASKEMTFFSFSGRVKTWKRCETLVPREIQCLCGSKSWRSNGFYLWLIHTLFSLFSWILSCIFEVLRLGDDESKLDSLVTEYLLVIIQILFMLFEWFLGLSDLELILDSISQLKNWLEFFLSINWLLSWNFKVITTIGMIIGIGL